MLLVRTIISFIVGLLIVGLVVAVLRVFDWNVVAAFEWLIGLSMSIVNTVADFFMGNPTFQEYVVK